MRILYLIDGLGTGGAERSLAEMLPGLAGSGIQPMIACLYRRQEGIEADVLAGGERVRFVGSTDLARQVRAIRAMIESDRPAIVHTTLFRSSLVGRLAAVGTPTMVLTSLVSTNYDPARFRDPNVRPLALRGVRLIDGWTARHLTDHFHAITHAVKRSAVNALNIPSHGITVIERGRDPSRLGRPSAERRHRARQALGLTQHHEVIVNVGRQEFAKGQVHLLRALAQLADRPKLVLLIAGRKGTVSAGLRTESRRLGLDGRVRFLGHRNDVPEVLAAADLFVFPSLYEGLGGALIEAMALGLPLVASNLEAVREIVEEGGNGLLAPPRDPSLLAGRIAELLDDQSRARRFGARSRVIFEQRFTADRFTARMVQLYHRLTTPGRDQRISLSTASTR
jgi:glycosyltransferase involved in cell wall biosynthesis